MTVKTAGRRRARRSPSSENRASSRTKIVLEIVGLVCTIGGTLAAFTFAIAKLIGVAWIVITPDPTLGLALATTSSGQVELKLSTAVVIDNRGFGNTLLTGVFVKADFFKGERLQASSSDAQCVSSGKEILNLPIPLPASSNPLRLDCTASRAL